MEVSRRNSAGRGVVAGSVWESRMKMDEVTGGFKVFNGEEESHKSDQSSELVVSDISTTSETKQSNGVVRERRKTWKAEPIEVVGGSQSHSRMFRLDPNNNKIGIGKHRRSNEKEFGVCKDKSISSSLSSLSQLRTQRLDSNDHEEYGSTEEEDKEEKGIEKKSFDVKEVDVFEEKPKRIVKEDKKVGQIYRKPIPISPNVKIQSTPMKDHSVVHQELHKPPPVTFAEESEKPPKAHNKLQNIVDLLMWRDVSKTAFMFGLGTFLLISLTYTEDLNISLISATSYMGLVYLAAIFIYKSIICSVARGDTNVENSIHLVGEEDAIWLVKLVIPYFNEILLKLKAVFSGDPATTMKLAILLFVMARFGSLITIGKLVKLGYFGAFTLPKVCSSYYPQFAAYGKSWIKHLRDSWHSCSLKKALIIVAFILLWNFSSMLTRIWAVFMLVVTVRYYQMSSPSKEHRTPEAEGDMTDEQGGRRQKQGVWANGLNQVKEKKES